MQGEVGREPQLLATYHYSWPREILVARRCKQTKLQDLGLPAPTICLWPNAGPSCVNGAVYYLQNWGKRWLTLTMVLVLETDTKCFYCVVFSTSFSVTLPKLFNRMPLLRIIQFWSDNMRTVNFQTCGWEEVYRWLGLHGLLAWPLYLLPLKLLKISSILCATPEYSWAQEELCQLFSKTTQETLQKMVKTFGNRFSFLIKQNFDHLEICQLNKTLSFKPSKCIWKHLNRVDIHWDMKISNFYTFQHPLKPLWRWNHQRSIFAPSSSFTCLVLSFINRA